MEMSKDTEEPGLQSGKSGIRKGLRCQVCTGCGLCPGVSGQDQAPGKLHILAELSGGVHRPLPAGKRLAVADIGTTTIAMLLYGADGAVQERFLAVNPQTEYGADVISRIRAAEEKSAADRMREQVRGVLESGLARFLRCLDAGEELLLVLAANTTESYLLMGWDTSELGRAPFRVSHTEAVRRSLSGVESFLFPPLSSFVGGDIVADLYGCGMAEREELTLLVDLGTNGELVLGNRKRRIACSTAAGPAFEGGANRGIWGADMVSVTAALLREGILDETGLLAGAYFETGVRAGNVCVTQQAVRAIQLAKAAVAAGIGILLEKYGAEEKDVERVILAGGFGYYLNPADAARIGLLPEALAKKAAAGGNLVLAGAKRAGETLLRGDAGNGQENTLGEGRLLRELAELKKDTETLNLAAEEEFASRYLAAMGFPPGAQNAEMPFGEA